MIFGAMADKAPRSRFIAALPLGFLAVLLGSISFDCVNAHGHVVSPRSRNWLAHSSQEGREPGQGTSTTPQVEYTPQGINRLQSSGRCGLSPNGNQYDAPKNVLGGILPPKIQATYVKGQQIDLEVVLTAHHKGHFTYSACALSAGQTTATQQCFDANKLMFVKDNLYGAPKDSRYPDRAYIPLTSYPGIQIANPSPAGGTAYKFNHRFQLPAGLSGDVVLIQWTYWTANSCIYPGYRTMSWPANYYDQGGLPDCAMTDFSTYLGGSIPELFWNCVEVKILNTPAPAPVPAPLPAPQPTSTSCNVIEENTDYTKSDICTTCPKSSTAEGCCSICAQTSGCGAYTWTNFNGGTCWLKSGKNGSTACSGCRSATMKTPVPIPVPAPAPITLPVPAPKPAPSPQSSSNCAASYTQGKLYAAGDQVSNVGNNYRCKQYPYSGWCSLAPSAYAPGTGTNWGDAWELIGPCGVAPVPVPAPQPTSCNVIEENVDYTKSDICTTCPKSSTAEGCCSICAKTSGCGAYTWTNFNGGTCWLKSGKNGSAVCTGCRSATMKNPAPIPVPSPAPITLPVPAPKPAPLPSPQSSSCSTIEENVDYTKSDICTTCPLSLTAEGCCSICAKTLGCGAYTWTNFNGGTCWLKSGKTGSTVCSGCRSATLKTMPNPIPLPVPAPKPVIAPQSSAAARVEAVLDGSKTNIDNKLFLYQTPQLAWLPSTVYRYSGFLAGLRVMYQTGVAGKKFYMGDDSQSNGHLYGLVNIAAFLAQSMKETIMYDACDENSWDLVNGKYPLSNACGQLGQSYQDYTCSDAEKFMECPVDKSMKLKAVTNAKWWGAPEPLFCGPKTAYPFTGYWDHNAACPQTCSAYPGQLGGSENNGAPAPNKSGRTDVEGCCWWGRGVIQTSGVCNFGQLNYYLGKRASIEGRTSMYPSIDFCANPESICASTEFPELKWVAGYFYWIKSVQDYNSGGWNYMAKLRQFVDGGMTDTAFIDSVSAFVNRGCALPPCQAGPVDGLGDRAANFRKALQVLGLVL